jgi:hypothetical protein
MVFQLEDVTIVALSSGCPGWHATTYLELLSLICHLFYISLLYAYLSLT